MGQGVLRGFGGGLAVWGVGVLELELLAAQRV